MASQRQTARQETASKPSTQRRSAGFLLGCCLMLASACLLWRWGSQPPVLQPEPGVTVSKDAEVRAPTPQAEVPPTQTLPLAREPVPSPQHPLLAALDRIQTERDPSRQNEALEALARSVAASDLAASLEFLNQPEASAIRRDLEMRLVRRWAADAPRDAAGWVSQADLGPARQEAVNDVAIAWANQNLADATEWARQLREGGERNDGLTSVAYEAARTQPEAALHLAMELPVGEARDDLITHAASQWAAQTPEAALEWARQLTEPELRERVLTAIATVWGATDPVAAGRFAVQELNAGRPQDDAVVGIVQRWVQREPEAAAAWVVAFPEGSLRDTALEELVKIWSDQDAAAATAWLNQSPLPQTTKEKLSGLRPG